MKVCATRLALGAALALGGALVASTCPQASGQEAEFNPRQVHFLSGGCTMKLSPDRALIAGGVSSSALKPSDAVDQLEKELGLMKNFVAEKHGELRLMERVRTVKNPQPGRTDTEAPFQVVQRIQVTIPADAPVDAILEKLIELGMDRFGDNILNNFNRRGAVIRFQISDFDQRMNDFEQSCTIDSWKQWCAKGAGVDEKACDSPKPPANLEVQSFNVRSKEKLMRADGATAIWQWSYNRGGQRPPEPPELLGNMTVQLEGVLNLTIQTENENP
jgi:hypothetical protein